MWPPPTYSGFLEWENIFRGYFRDDEEVTKAVRQALVQVNKRDLLVAFQEWMKRLQRSVVVQGDHAEQQRLLVYVQVFGYLCNKATSIT